MQTRHVPQIDRRYWFGIIFASIFGTNLGDLYAHDSGLGLGLGLLVLIVLFGAVIWIESKDRLAHELYYWFAIIIVRTGATNIADALAYRVRIPALELAVSLAAIVAVLAWFGAARPAQGGKDAANPARAEANATYWVTMLGAGVFGTVAGDICSHRFGQGPSSIGLGLMLVVFLIAARSRAATQVAPYWCAVALARTAGTCMGDWLAENRFLQLGLPISTLLSGTAFIGLLLLWRSAPVEGANTGADPALN